MSPPRDDKGKDLFEYLQQKLEATTEDFNSLLKKILEEPCPAAILDKPEFSREKVLLFVPGTLWSFL